MRRLLPSLLLLCAFSGGSCGGCAHLGSAFGHLGGMHVSSGGGGAHFSAPAHVVVPAVGPSLPRVAPSAVMASEPPPALLFGGGFHLRHALAAGIDGLEIAADAADMDSADSEEELELVADVNGLCRSFADCGDGLLGQGALCDRTFRQLDPDAVGVCRDACRDDHDCPAPLQCRTGLDPSDRTWGGCVP